MKKNLLVIAFAILVTGCNDKSKQLSKAKDAAACHNNGGVYMYSDLLFPATCKDGITVNSTKQTGELVNKYLIEIENKK